MRVLQVVHGFPPFNLAGAEVFAHGLSRALQARGHEVEVFHRIADRSRPEYDVERAEVDGLPVIRVNHTFRESAGFEHSYRNEVIDRIFAGLLEARAPDVVQFHHVTCLSTNLIAVAHRAGVPVVYTLHDYWLICQRGQLLRRDLSICPGQEDGECVRCLAWQLDLRGGRTRIVRALQAAVPSLSAPRTAGLRRLARSVHGLYSRAFLAAQPAARGQVRARMEHVHDMCRLVDRFVAPSRFLRDRFVEFGVPRERIELSPYGFDTGSFHHPRRADDGTVRFGYLGTWIPPKGLHVLIDAFNRIADERIHLHVHGHAVPYEGHEDYEENLKGMIRSPRIHWEGRYDHRRVGEILAGLDVLVVPSIWYENAPLTIQEAFLAGVPVIASDLGGMRELVQDGVNGMTFRARDALDLQAKVVRLAADPALRDRLRPEPGSVKTVERSAAEHEALFRRLGGRAVAEAAVLAS